MEELLIEFQKVILGLIPESWARIDFYATIGNGKKAPGELFFYFLPSSFFKSEYINCYEIPSQYNIDENDYLELINRLYLLIKKMHNLDAEKGKRFWNNITINMNFKLNTIKFEFSYIDFEDFPFSSYERHIIWRFINLNIFPVNKEEKKAIEKYNKFINEYNIPKEVKYLNLNFKENSSFVDYGKVLNIDEAINKGKEKE